MGAEIVTIADALVAAINAGTFTAPYAALAAVRAYDAVYEPADLDTLQVTVVPANLGTLLASRRDSQTDYGVDIGFHKRTDGSRAALDALILLVEEVSDFCLRLDLLSGTVRAIGTQTVPLYSAAHLEEFRVFLSVLTVTFRMLREV